jgi:hypothetical protein
MSTANGPSGFCFGSQVSFISPPGDYLITGTLLAVTPNPDGDFAVMIVTQAAGLYRRGDVVTLRLSWLRPVA